MQYTVAVSIKIDKNPSGEVKILFFNGKNKFYKYGEMLPKYFKNYKSAENKVIEIFNNKEKYNLDFNCVAVFVSKYEPTKIFESNYEEEDAENILTF